MCGRFSLSAELSDILALVEGLTAESAPAPRYNIAPTQTVAVVLNRGSRRLTECRWGLIPFWAREESIGAKMINARAETLVEKPVFNNPLRAKRCLILADGFYEWGFPTERRGPKLPWFIRLKSGKPFAFAGLWSSWQPPEGDPVKSCIIITTAANEAVKKIHSRMPVILEPSDFDLWLRPEKLPPERLMPLLNPYPEDLMEAYQVSRRINNVANDDARLQEPWTQKPLKPETESLDITAKDSNPVAEE